SIAAQDASAFLIVDGAVQRMRQRANQQRCGTGRQDGVGVERHDVPHATQRLHISDDRTERVLRPAAEETIELRQLASLAFPPHPDALGRVPASVAVKEIEGVVRFRRVARVERAHTVYGGAEYGVVVFFTLGWRVGEVAEDGEVEVGL